MTSEKKSNVEIRKVANGYVVTSPDHYGSGRMVDNSDVFVFESFVAMANFLRDNFEPAVA